MDLALEARQHQVSSEEENHQQSRGQPEGPAILKDGAASGRDERIRNQDQFVHTQELGLLP